MARRTGTGRTRTGGTATDTITERIIETPVGTMRVEPFSHRVVHPVRLGGGRAAWIRHCGLPLSVMGTEDEPLPPSAEDVEGRRIWNAMAMCVTTAKAPICTCGAYRLDWGTGGGRS